MYYDKELDEFAAGILKSMLFDSNQQIQPRTNPFNPVGTLENFHQSLFSVMKAIKEYEEDQRGTENERVDNPENLKKRIDLFDKDTI